MKRLKLNLDQLGKELEMLDNEHLRAIKGGWDGGYGAYGGYNSWEELLEAMQNGYMPPEGDYSQGGYGGYGDYGWDDYGNYSGYNGGWPWWYSPGGDYGGYGSYGSYGGYNVDPLPNGDCLFNMVAYMLDGNTDEAQCYKDELMNQYTFTEATLENGLPAYSYDPDDVASYMSSYSSGYHISYGDLPNASDIQSVLNKDGGKIGVSYNGHNYIAKAVDGNGKVKLFDPTNPQNPDIYISPSEFTGVYNFYRN